MSSENVKEVGDQNFNQEVIQSEVPVLVDFWGPACGPCKALEPLIEQVAINYQGRIKVTKINVDQNPQTAIQFAVRSLPTLLLFKSGKVVHQITGRPSINAIDKSIQKVLP